VVSIVKQSSKNGINNNEQCPYPSTQVNGLPVAEVMDTWTKQMGYPVLDLSISGSVATLTQTRFLLDPKANASQPPSPLGSDALSGFRNLALFNSLKIIQ